MVVKFGHGVRSAEAEALHLVSTCTTIATPKLLSAYILNDIGYIVMTYERGKSLQNYWDHASPAQKNRIIEQLQDYVNQVQKIPGDFIGGPDRSPCGDGIFDTGPHALRSIRLRGELQRRNGFGPTRPATPGDPRPRTRHRI